MLERIIIVHQVGGGRMTKHRKKTECGEYSAVKVVYHMIERSLKDAYVKKRTPDLDEPGHTWEAGKLYTHTQQPILI